jgi:adenylate cyclase
MIGRLRLWSGMLLFAYAGTHLLNHTLGIVSLEAMEAGLRLFTALWRNPLGTILLYGALLLHIALVLWSLFMRRHLRMSRSEWVQLVLGLSILPLGMVHFVGTRGAHEIYGVNANYAWTLLSFLAAGWEGISRQVGLVLVVWIHGCIGLHRAWRLRRWYAPVRPWLLGATVALPCLSLAGMAVALRDMADIMARPEALQALVATLNAPGNAAIQQIYALSDNLKLAFAALLAGVLLARPLRDLWHRRTGVVKLAYAGLAGGPRVVTFPVGLSILEASRASGIPHASVCGGRGRCSTCRARIGGDHHHRLPAPSEAERRVLARIDAPDGVRLACQLRPPAGSWRVTPLLPATVGPAEAWRSVAGAHGSERIIAVLFCDLRGFTSLAEGRLPYDTVFILNRYFRAVGEAVAAAGGRIDKFIGDGAMALFGAGPEARPTAETTAAAAREALDAARRIAIAVDELNASLTGDLDLPLRLGIGLHAGTAIVGEMGYGRAVSLTAIGDTVNTASRLESATKELTCELVVSDDLLRLAGVSFEHWPAHLLEVRGRQGRLAVRAVADAALIEITTVEITAS